MRIVQRTFLYIISIAIIVDGALFAAYPFSEQARSLVAAVLDKPMLCLLLGLVAVALGVFTLLPFDLFNRKGRSISFAGQTGTVSILIDSFEVSLRKTIAKLPMVKRVSVEVTPKDNNRRVGIEATVSLKKPAESSTRETAERLREFIDKVSRQILGADEVMTVDVRIEDVLIDPSQTAESLNGIFAAAEKNVTPVERTVTPLATAVAAVEEPADEVEEQEPERYLSPTPIAQADAREDVAKPKTSSLLTYEEAEELEHARLADANTPDSDEPKEESVPSGSSFQSLAAGPDEEDEPKTTPTASA